MASDSQSESRSQDTASTSLVEDNLTISFENIFLQKRENIFGTDRKTILKGLSGTFNAGELTMIMGPSGAGKSSLLHILAGYTKESSGIVMINDRQRDLRKFKRQSCYIFQDDKLHEFLTVSESMRVAADLRLGNYFSNEKKNEMIQLIIEALNLKVAKDTNALNLSGGQKKRLAIGLELVSDPKMMFFDEPTSGLDMSTATNVVQLLKQLASMGRTVVATIHQPSKLVLDMVDKLYVVENGRCAYMGSVNKLVPFLESCEQKCPLHHNPVDFLMELCGEETDDGSKPIADSLVKMSNNGLSNRWSSLNLDTAEAGSSSSSNGDAPRSDFIRNTSVEDNVKKLKTLKENSTNNIMYKVESSYPTSFLKQCYILTKREFLSYYRNPWHVATIMSIHFLMALLVGTLFYNLGPYANYGWDIYKYLFFSLMFIMFTAFNGVSINFPEQLPVIRREHFNKWYMSGAYYWAKLISSILLQTVSTFVYALPSFLLTGQPNEFTRFYLYFAALLLTSYVAICLGLLNGSIFNVKFGVICGPFMIMPYVVFSGFFLLYTDTPRYLKWIFHVSFLKHGLAAISIPIFGMNRETLKCLDTKNKTNEIDDCSFRNPRKVLIDFSVTDKIKGTRTPEMEYWNDVHNMQIAFGALLCIFAILNILSIFMLKIRLKYKW